MDGGAGNDTLYAVITGSVTPLAMNNIENASVTNTTTAATIDFSNATGLSSVTNQASTVGLTISGISKSGPSVTVRDTSVAGQVVSFNDVTGSADSATVAINNLSSGSTLTVAGVETLTLQSNGSAANVLGSATVVGLIDTAATRLNVTGSQGLTFSPSSTAATANVNILPANIVYLDASGNTSTTTGVTATMQSTNAATVVGSAGNDSIATFGTGNDSITMGAGNDTIWFTNGGSWTVNDTVNGGAGTDTLRVVAANIAAVATPTTYNTTLIETIQITDALAATTYTPANISSTATTLNITGNTANTGIIITTGAAIAVTGSTIVGPAGTFSIGLGTSLATNTLGVMAAGGTTTITDTGTATTDSLTITNNAMVTSGAMLNVFNGQILPISGYETVTINTGSSSGVQQTLAAITLTPDSSAATTLNFTGVNSVQLTAATVGADTINASGITASGTGITSTTAAFFMTAGSATGGTTITGSGGIDVLIGNTSSASSISGGAGNDVITGGSGNDTILGGTGNDSITSGAGNDSILGGDGDDQITMGANLASGDVIDGGAGTDTLLVSAAIAASAAAGVTNVEIISFSATATQDMTAFLNSGITTVGATAGAITVSNAQTSLNTIILGAAGATAVTGANLTRLVDGTADSLSLLLLDGTTGTTTLVTPSLANEETLTIGESGTDSTAAVTFALGTVTATSLTRLNVTGSNNHSMTLSGETALATVAASSATGTLNIAGGNSAVNMTVTGPSTTAMSIVGGSGNDSITGGAAADSITGGAGADTIIGNAGNDTIIGGLGADSLVGGDGTDTISVAYTLGTDGGSTAATGVVVNLSSSAILASTIAGYKTTGVIGDGIVLGVSSDISSVAPGTSVNVGLTANVATTSSRVDTLSGFEAIQGSTGTDYLVGNSSANTITGGTGADVMVGGSGADTFVLNTLSSVAPTAVNAAVATTVPNTWENTDTLSFGAGVDVITDFVSGTDFLDLTTAGVAPVAVSGVLSNANMVAGTSYFVVGTYVIGTGVFTINSAATSATANVATLVVDAAAGLLSASTGIVILMGVAAAPAAADII